MRNLTRSVVYRLQVVGQRGAWVALTAAQDRMSLRKTDWSKPFSSTADQQAVPKHWLRFCFGHTPLRCRQPDASDSPRQGWARATC